MQEPKCEICAKAFKASTQNCESITDFFHKVNNWSSSPSWVWLVKVGNLSWWIGVVKVGKFEELVWLTLEILAENKKKYVWLTLGILTENL